MVLCSVPLAPLCIVRARPVGVLPMIDGGEKVRAMHARARGLSRELGADRRAETRTGNSYAWRRRILTTRTSRTRRSCLRMRSRKRGASARARARAPLRAAGSDGGARVRITDTDTRRRRSRAASHTAQTFLRNVQGAREEQARRGGRAPGGRGGARIHPGVLESIRRAAPREALRCNRREAFAAPQVEGGIALDLTGCMQRCWRSRALSHFGCRRARCAPAFAGASCARAAWLSQRRPHRSPPRQS